MRSKIFRTFLVIAIAIAVMCTAFAAPGTDKASQENVSIKAEIGFNGFYKIGYSTPLQLEVENKQKDINGEIQVEMPNENNTAVLYAVNVSLPANSTKKITMDLPMMRFVNTLEIKIVEGKNVVAAKKVRINPGLNSEIYAIGLLSDDYEGIKYINKAPLRASGSFNANTNVVKLSADNFPGSLETAKLFDTIVINNFDTAKLEAKQYEALKKWVKDGGILLIGTGSSYNKTLNVFKDDFLSGKIGEITQINTDELGKLVRAYGAESMKLDVLDMEFDNSKAILEENGYSLVRMLEKDKGVVGIAAFDLGMGPVSNWDSNGRFMEVLLGRIMPTYYNSLHFQKDMMMRQNGYAMDASLRNIPELPMPKTTYMFIVYAIYIMIVAPISYMILKRLDKRELMWIVVPAMSILFSVGIYVVGFGTRLTEPVVNIISIAEIKENGTFAPVSYAGVFTPVKSNIKVETGDGMTLRSNTLVADYGYYGRPQSENAPKQILSKITLTPKTSIEFFKNQIWSMKTVSLDHENVLNGRLDAKINYIDKSIKGTILNQTGLDILEGFIITPNQVFKVGAFKNGETITIDEKAQNYAGNRYDLMSLLYKDPYSMPRPAGKRVKLTEEEIQNFKYNLQKRQVLEFVYWEGATSGATARFIAWSATPMAKDIYVNGKKTKVIEKTLIASDVTMNLRNGKMVEYPLGYIKPVIINNMNAGNYDEYGKAFYGKGSFELHYAIDKDIDVENIAIQYNTGSNIKQFIWDMEKNDWAEGKYSNYTISKTRASRYIDKNNMLKLKFELNDDHIQLPQISLKGSVR